MRARACGLARAEQRQVLIPHGVERHHAARGGVGKRKRVCGGWDGSCEILGSHYVYFFRDICRIMELNLSDLPPGEAKVVPRPKKNEGGFWLLGTKLLFSRLTSKLSTTSSTTNASYQL